MSKESASLPSTWVVVTLADVTAHSPEKVEPDRLGNVKYIGLEHIESGTNRISGTGETTHVKSTKTVFRSGDVLYGRLRPYLRKVCRPQFDGACSTEILVFPQGSHLDNGLLLHFLSQQSTAEFAVQNSNGINLPRISPKALGKIRFPLPPLPEQRRIVAKIESLQERSSRARAALAEVGPLLEQFRRSVLSAAFSGRLTADWRAANPDIEPASELLHRIRTERRQRWEQAELAKYEAKGKKPPNGWKEKYPVVEHLDTKALPPLPSSWTWCRLPELGYMNRGKSRHRPRNASHLYGGSHPFVQTGDIAQADGYIKHHKQTYSEAGLAQSKLWPTGTVCITIAANIASSAILTYPACFPDSVVGVIPDSELCSSEFIEYFIRTAKENLERFAPSTAQKNINLSTLAELAVPLPPPEESAEIARLVSDGMRMATRLEKILSDSENHLTQLNQSILAKAFRGELVPQDPADEPAAELLARIAAARATAASSSKTSKRARKPAARKAANP